MCEMNRRIKEPYKKYKQQRRQKFNCPFVARKLITMLEYDSKWLAFLPEIEDKKQLELQEEIWTNICRELGWI